MSQSCCFNTGWRTHAMYMTSASGLQLETMGSYPEALNGGVQAIESNWESSVCLETGIAP